MGSDVDSGLTVTVTGMKVSRLDPLILYDAERKRSSPYVVVCVTVGRTNSMVIGLPRLVAVIVPPSVIKA